MRKALLATVVSIMFFTLILTSSIPAGAPEVPEPPPPVWLVRLVGHVDSYGTDPAFGWLHARAVVGKGLAKVHLFCVPKQTEITHPGIMINKTGTYSFIAARLVNATRVALNYTGKDLFIAGYWNAYNITWIYYGDRNFTWMIVPLVINGTGELWVISNWTRFTVRISGIEPFKGKVVWYRVAPILPRPELISLGDYVPVGDVDCDRQVGYQDLTLLTRAYGATPGKSNYNLDVDLNFDFCVNYRDLYEFARHYGKTY